MRQRVTTTESWTLDGSRKISRARAVRAFILSFMFRFAATLTLAGASALAAALAPAALGGKRR
jgi:hypothetical protein